ncbi:MAG: hypothetical protein BAJATHORv1_10346 [Candidatus Thorarchaeota archaeon]|nr:MAG: hypothetical protein BAJATHORv1_10346 [Candidatus Thorarchaeota archaeon]
MKSTTTTRCKLCDEEIVFDIDDASTYLSKTETGNPLIGILYTVRVEHRYKEGVAHINVIVVDERGEYRAHKDCYEEVKLEDPLTKYEEIVRQFPIEIRHFLSLATPVDKFAISNITLPESAEVSEWTEILRSLRKENPESQLFSFLDSKWASITGRTEELLEMSVEKDSWIYPVQIRVKGRKKLTPELLEKTKELTSLVYPDQIELEAALAQGENYIRSVSMEDMESLYQQMTEKWGHDTRVGIKTAMTFLQGMYWYLKYRVGTQEESLKPLETAFNFCQIVENREAISMIGNLYASVLRNKGESEEARKVLNLVLNVCRELGDERCQVVVSANLSIVEFKQGLFEQSLERTRWVYEHPITQADLYLRITTLANMAESLFTLKRYREAGEMCKNALEIENIPNDLYIGLLSKLKQIAVKTNSMSDIQWVKEHIPDNEYMSTPKGHRLLLDIKAVEAELKRDWLTMVELLKKERELAVEHNFMEDLNEIEFRIAEGYVMLYQEGHEVSHLHQAYKHLDLAKTLALEANYHPDIVKLTMIKGLVAVEADMYDRAKAHFQEAFRLAEIHQLDDLAEEIRVYLSSLDSEDIKLEQDFQAQFDALTGVGGITAGEKEPGKVFAIWISREGSDFDMLLLSTTERTVDHAMYLRGLADLWQNLSLKIDSQIVESFKGSCGHIIQEFTDDFKALVLCNRMDYLAKRNIQDIIERLEKFPLKEVDEELSVKVLSEIESKFGNFEPMEIKSDFE